MDWHDVPQQWCRWKEDVRGRSRSSVRFGRAALCFLFSMSSLWSPCFESLGMRGQIQPCAVFLFADPLTARVSAYDDDITVFVSCHQNIETVKEAVDEYERIARAKVNFDKSEGLRLRAWRGRDTLPGLFYWSDGPVRILGVWFGPYLQLKRNWSEVQVKVNAQVGTWLSRRLFLKGRAEACAVYVFPLILYRLVVLLLSKAHRLVLQRSLSRLLWGGQRLTVRRQVCIQRTHNGGLACTDLLKDSHT